MGVGCPTLDPFGPIKDTSNVDGGKIRSALTLEINCSTGQADREPCSNSTRRQKVRKERKKRSGEENGGHTRIGNP